MIYEIHLKIRLKNEPYEKSYFEAWRMESKSFLPYTNPILEKVFTQEWPHKIPPPENNDIYMVLVMASSSSPKELNRVFTRGRNLIRDYIKEKEQGTFLVFEGQEAE